MESVSTHKFTNLNFKVLRFNILVRTKSSVTLVHISVWWCYGNINIIADIETALL